VPGPGARDTSLAGEIALQVTSIAAKSTARSCRPSPFMPCRRSFSLMTWLRLRLHLTRVRVGPQASATGRCEVRTWRRSSLQPRVTIRSASVGLPGGRGRRISRADSGRTLAGGGWDAMRARPASASASPGSRRVNQMKAMTTRPVMLDGWRSQTTTMWLPVPCGVTRAETLRSSRQSTRSVRLTRDRRSDGAPALSGSLPSVHAPGRTSEDPAYSLGPFESRPQLEAVYGGSVESKRPRGIREASIAQPLHLDACGTAPQRTGQSSGRRPHCGGDGEGTHGAAIRARPAARWSSRPHDV